MGCDTRRGIPSEPRSASHARHVPERTCARLSAIARFTVPPAGFEPAISALKGLRPRPLDDEGSWAALKLMYRSSKPEYGFDHGFGVLEIVEKDIGLMGLERDARKVARGDRHDPGTTRACAGD